ncbi:MAG: sulfurtransferase TusA family protein [Burkholderiales bacterium]|nr:sulfurtransferase TusA family protein [Burkholderiales bacterium]
MSGTQPKFPHFDEDWDAGDLGCGDLVIRLRFRLKAMQPGQVLRVHATDAGAREDLPAWCRMTGEILLVHEPEHHLYFIQRTHR